MAKESPKQPQVKDPDTDHFPTAADGLARLLDSDNQLDVQVRRIDIRFAAAGHGVYRMWEGREDEPLVGVIPT